MKPILKQVLVPAVSAIADRIEISKNNSITKKIYLMNLTVFLNLTN